MARRKDNDSIQLSKEEIANASDLIKTYIEDNFDIEIGNLQSEIFLDYITKNIGIYYYNKGIMDSMSLMGEKIEDLYLLMKDEEYK